LIFDFTMQSPATQLASLIEEYKTLLPSIPATAMEFKPSPAKWSRKEIVGHLIDSAQSNIRRFVVAQYEDTPFIVYNQDKWVALVNYQQWNTNDIIDLWYLLNKQIVMIWRNTSNENAQRNCLTQELHTIEWLARDYIRHLKHHMHVVLDREPFPYP
jgi:hypothetical protein